MRRPWLTPGDLAMSAFTGHECWLLLMRLGNETTDKALFGWNRNSLVSM